MASVKRRSDEEIIAALIAQGSIKEAAAELGCTARTIYERMKKPDFKALYERAKGDLLKTVTARLQGSACKAVSVLEEIMGDPETAPQTRANCAASILQYTARYTETADIIERLEAIEEQARAAERESITA